jgi:hypothetical protein
MDNHQSFSSKHIISFPAFLAVVALFVGPSLWAQQQQLNDHYAKAAFLSLLAIESDISSPQDKSSGAAEMKATQSQIDAADALAVSAQEASTTRMLRQIYQLKLQDNDLLRAYRKLAEIENAEDSSDQAVTRKQKDYAVSQLADGEAAIQKREDACFGQLEQSLREHTLQSTPACSEWIGKAKISHPDNERLKSATSDARDPGKSINAKPL